MYFPAMVRLEGKKVLVVGGGRIAADKIEKLLDFTCDITVIAPRLSDRTKKLIENSSLRHIQRPYRSGDIEGYFFVVVAVDDVALQKEIYEEAQSRKIFVNSVDSVEYCDFIFPSYIKRGDLVVAFSTSGASPSLAKYLRRAIERLLPADIGDFTAYLKELRARLPKGKSRMERLDGEAKRYIEKHFGRSDV